MRTAAAALAATLLSAVLAAQGGPFKPFDRKPYETHAATLGATEAQLQVFGREIDEQGAGRAGDRLLRSLVPAFEKAAGLREQGDPRAPLELAKVLASTTDPVLQGHLRYHLSRAFLDGDDPERAIEVLESYVRENANRTPLDDEVVYYFAHALAELPNPDEAVRLFQAYLDWFPAASERYRATAHQRLNELRGQRDNPLHELADGMKKVGRDLGKQRTGKPTQDEQQQLLTRLEELIEMFEEMERQSSGSPSGTGPSSNPAANSALPDGEATVGNLNPVRGVADRWGDMKDADRKKIEAEVQNNLPPEYRKMLEEYYKKLGTGGAR